VELKQGTMQIVPDCDRILKERALPPLILTADCTDYTDFFSVFIRAIREIRG
jgi:hypothetical protein